MPAKTKIQTATTAFALAAILLFSSLSAGVALCGWLLPYFLAPFMLVVNIMGLTPWIVCLALGAGALAAIGAWFVARRRWLRDCWRCSPSTALSLSARGAGCAWT